MTTISSTLQINLVDDVTKNAPRVAAALEKMQKEAASLQTALAKSGTTDKLQARLKTLGASESHIEGVTKAWRDFSRAQALAERSSDWTRTQAAGVKVWEDATVAAVRLVKKEEAAHAKARHDQLVRAEQEAIRAAQHKVAEERRLGQEAARDARKLAEQEARDRRMLDQQATRDAEREEHARLQMLAREQRQAAKRAQELAHERSRTDNTVAGVTALYAAHSAMHAAVKVGERYREFDKERRYAQVVMGASDAQMKPLVDQAIRGSANSKFNDVQWLAAQRNLAARGYNRDQVLGFTPTASQLGQAFDISMEDGVKLFEGAMLGFKKDVSTEAAAKQSAQRTADLEVKTSKISGADADDLIQLYKRGAAAAQMAGLTEEQLLAFGGTAKKVNIGGDEAATAFVALTKNLLHPTHEARTAMTASGIDFSRYQKIGPVNEEGFATEVARNYGVKLKAGVRAGLHRIFADPEMMADPAKFTPAITRLLRRDLHGNDAKSLKSIAGLAGRYRDDSATGVDTQGLLSAIMAGLSKNPALANVIFGSKQGGRISAGLNPEMFAHLLDELKNHSEGFAEKVSDARMAGFNGALDKLSNQLAILETSIGRSFDNDGNGGFLTNATLAATKFVQVLGEANPRLLRVGGEAVLLAGAFAALKSVDFLRGGFGLKASASALDLSAKLLDDAAIKLGASKGGVPAGGEPASTISEGPPKAPSKGFFGEGGFKSAPKGILAGGPAAIAEYFAYQVATGLIDTGVEAGRDLVASKDKQYRADKFNEQSFPQKFGFFGGSSDPMDPRFAPPLLKDSAPPKVPTAAPDDEDETTPIAGKRATGGPVSRGKTYLVGEHGPELFTPGMNGAISTSDVQRLLSRASYTTPGEGDRETAKAVRAMAFGLANAVDGIARAIDRLDETKLPGFSGDDGTDSGGTGGISGGRHGFMERHGHFGGRRGFMERNAGGGTVGPGNLSDGPIAKFKTGKLFAQKAPQIMARLQRDFGLNQTEAAAVLGNLGHESAGFKAFEEGGHGPGRGWAQWTDPGRKRRFFEYAQRAGLDPKSDEANYGFLRWELKHTHKQAIAALKAAGTPEAKMQAFERSFEGAGVKNYPSRMRYMNEALGAAKANPATADADPAAGPSTDAGSGVSSSKAVDTARGMIGFGDSAAEQALHHYMHSGAWCADFVNGTLAKIGGRGTNNALAASFFRWGKQVSPDQAKSGDVMVSSHHVGFAEGPAQMHNGRMMVPMISGNHGHRVGESWEPLDKYQIRHGEAGDATPDLQARHDNPLGLKRSRDSTLGLHASLEALHGLKLAPAVDNRHLERTAELLEHIHHRIKGINTASAQHRGSGGQTRIAGLGSRTRGSFSSGGLTIG